MNMNMLFKIKLPLLVASSLFMIGCDSSTELEFGGISLEDITPVDQNVVAGELFTLEDTLNLAVEQDTNNFRVVSNNLLVRGVNATDDPDEPTFIYQTTGVFNASISGEQDVETIVPNAVFQTFSTDNAANTEVRSLLLVTDRSQEAPDLTSDQIDRLIELFNVSGATFFRESQTSNTILVNTTEVWSFTSTSTQAERATGLIGGTYSFQSATREIIFAITLLQDNEGNSFEFYLPVLSPELLPLELREQGTYTLQLANEVGF